MTSIDAYLPVPTISRDENSLPPITRFVSGMARPPLLYPPPIGLTISTRSPSRSTVASLALFGVTSRFTATAVYWRLTLSCTSSPSTFKPSATSRSFPLTTIFINKTAASPRRVRPFLSPAVFPSLALPSAGSRGPGPHPVLRNPPPTTSRGVYHRGSGRSGERQLAAGLGHHPRQRAVYPLRSWADHHGSRAHVERLGIAPRRRRAAVSQRAGSGQQTPAHLDDGGVAGAEMLERAIDDVALAFLDRLVLHAEARNTAEHARAVRFPVHPVVVVAIRRGADVAIGLGGRRQVVAHVSAAAGHVQIDLFPRQRPVRMPGDHPVDAVGVVHRHPDVRLRDLLVEIGRRHRVERRQELGDAPQVLAVGARALGADQNAVIGVDHLEARRAVRRLHRRADAEAGRVELARDLGVGVIERRVQERDVARVDAALHRLEPVALLHPLGGKAVGIGQERPFQVRQGWRRARRPHVGPDQLLARVADVADLRAEAAAGLVRHLEAPAVHPERPAVIHAAHARFLDAAEVERGQAVRAELADQPGPAVLRAKRDQTLAQ